MTQRDFSAIREYFLSGFEREITLEMIYMNYGKNFSKVAKMGYNVQVIFAPDVDISEFLQQYQYKPIIKNPIIFEPYLDKKEYSSIRKFCVKNLNESDPIRERDLIEAFSSIAKIHKVKLSFKNGDYLGYGQIHFYDPQDVTGNILLEKTIKGRTVTLQKYQKQSSKIITFELQGIHQTNANSLQTEKEQVSKSIKEQIAKVLAGINHTSYVFFVNSTNCMINVDSMHSANIQVLLKEYFKNAKFDIKYSKNSSPFMRLFVGNLKTDADSDKLKSAIQRCLNIKVLKCDIMCKDIQSTGKKLISGDLFLTDPDDGKKVITESKYHQDIRNFFVDGKNYFNIKLIKKMKKEINSKMTKYKSKTEQIKKEKDSNKNSQLMTNLITKASSSTLIAPHNMNYFISLFKNGQKPTVG